jgi:hypothetical protein
MIIVSLYNYAAILSSQMPFKWHPNLGETGSGTNKESAAVLRSQDPFHSLVHWGNCREIAYCCTDLHDPFSIIM